MTETIIKEAEAQCRLSAYQEMPVQPAEQAVTTLAVTRWRQGEVTVVADALAQEVPIAFVYNGISHVVMMATPADLEDFAYGFSFTEGIITARKQIYGVEAKAIEDDDGQLQGIELHIELATEQFVLLKAQRRNLTGRTGCGLCGAESLQQVFKHPGMTASAPTRLDAAVIANALAALQSQQPLQQMTGATHATALADKQGNIVCVREDVGRHNALDKLIGCLLRQQVDWSACWLDYWVLTTSRASYEMVQKVAMAGGQVLVAMSAPTALAVNLAKEYGFYWLALPEQANVLCIVVSLAKQAKPDSHWKACREMDVEKLIKMANQIGDFFEANPDAEEAQREIASHLKKFWNSVMINSLVSHVQQHQGQGLHPQVIAAVQQYVKLS